MLQHLRVHRAYDVQIGVAEIIQFLYCRDFVRPPRCDNYGFAIYRQSKRLVGRRGIGNINQLSRRGQKLCLAVDKISNGDRANGCLGHQVTAKNLWPLLNKIRCRIQIRRHGNDVGADDLTVLVQICLGDIYGTFDNRLRAS